MTSEDLSGKRGMEDVPATRPESIPTSKVSTISGSAEKYLCTFRNLDSGEVAKIGRDFCVSKFLGRRSVDPRHLAKAAGLCWHRWWSEKYRKDERLWCAAGSDDVFALQEALAPPSNGDAPIEVNSRSLHGRTALHIASEKGHVANVELILDSGAKVNACTHDGLTPLHLASRKGHVEVARLLLDWGAEAHPESNDRNLPLHMAAAAGRTEVVDLLMQQAGSKAALLQRNSLGQTPAEASITLRTAAIFVDACRISGDANARHNMQRDRYAGRTPFHEANILIPNSRADAVHRILLRTQQCPAEDPHSKSVSLVASRCRRVRLGTKARAPFAKVCPHIPAAEIVGPDSFSLVKLLGKGAFGEVFQVRHKRTQASYAMKVMPKRKVTTGKCMSYTRTERNVLSYIQHPFIVSLLYAFQTADHLVLVLQFCSRGNVQELIRREGRLEDPLACHYTAEILLALCHVHARNIIFRDLKPENCVLDESWHCLLTDFGLSKEGVSGIRGTSSFCGSMAFLAPEILAREEHGHPVDIYGLGVMLFNMLTGLPPHHSPDRKILRKNIKKASLSMPTYVSHTAGNLIQALLKRDPSQRLGATYTAEVQTHPYFSSVDFAALLRREVSPPTPSTCDVASRQPAAPIPCSPFRAGDAHRESCWCFGQSEKLAALR